MSAAHSSWRFISPASSLKVRHSGCRISPGDKCNRLTVISEQFRIGSSWSVVVECDCGVFACVRVEQLSNSTKSCGCGKRESASQRAKARNATANPTPRKHGKSRGKSRVYWAWMNMKARCTYPNRRDWKYYGGKGIVVCPEWMEFAVFEAWALANGYQHGLAIDRINSSGSYCPENCQWITQADNARKAVHLREHNRRIAKVQHET